MGDESDLDSDTILALESYLPVALAPDAIVLGELATDAYHLVGLTQRFVTFCHGLQSQPVDHRELDCMVYHPFVEHCSTIVPNLSIETLKEKFYQPIAANNGTIRYEKLLDNERDEFILQMFASNSRKRPAEPSGVMNGEGVPATTAHGNQDEEDLPGNAIYLNYKGNDKGLTTQYRTRRNDLITLNKVAQRDKKRKALTVDHKWIQREIIDFMIEHYQLKSLRFYNGELTELFGTDVYEAIGADIWGNNKKTKDERAATIVSQTMECDTQQTSVPDLIQKHRDLVEGSRNSAPPNSPTTTLLLIFDAILNQITLLQNMGVLNDEATRKRVELFTEFVWSVCTTIDTEDEPGRFNFVVKPLYNNKLKFKLSAKPSTTIAEVKASLSKNHGIAIVDQILVLNGNELDDCKNLNSCGIGKDKIVDLVLRKKGGGKNDGISNKNHQSEWRDAHKSDDSNIAPIEISMSNECINMMQEEDAMDEDSVQSLATINVDDTDNDGDTKLMTARAKCERLLQIYRTNANAIVSIAEDLSDNESNSCNKSDTCIYDISCSSSNGNENVDTLKMASMNAAIEEKVVSAVIKKKEDTANNNIGLALSELPNNSIILGLQGQHVENLPELSVRYRNDCESKPRRDIPIEELEVFFYRPFMANNADFFPRKNMDEFNGILYQYMNQDGISYCTQVPDDERDEAVKKDLYDYDLPRNAIVLGSNANKKYLPPLTVKYKEHRDTYPRHLIRYNHLEERFYRPFMKKNPDFFPRQHMDELRGCFFQIKKVDQVGFTYYQRVSDDKMDESIRDDIQRNGFRPKRRPKYSR